MRYWLGLAVAIAVGFSAASAQAQTPTPTLVATGTPVATPTAAPTIVPVGPGNPILPIAAPPILGNYPPLDRVLPALAGTDINEVLRQIFFLRLPCSLVEAIPCAPGQPVGTLVDGMWVTGCHSTWVAAGTPEVTDAVRAFLSSRQSLWAVTEAFLPNLGEFRAFYLPGTAALMDGHGITAFQYPCAIGGMSDFIKAVEGTNPRYILGPGNPPVAPATGTGPVPAEREDLRLWIASIFAMGAAVVVFGAALCRCGRRRSEH